MDLYKNENEVVIILWPVEVGVLSIVQCDVQMHYEFACSLLPAGFPVDGKIVIGLFNEPPIAQQEQLENIDTEIQFQEPYMQAKLDIEGNMDLRISETFLFNNPQANADIIKVSTNEITAEDKKLLAKMSIGSISLLRKIKKNT